jgi:serine/threonine protein kinase
MVPTMMGKYEIIEELGRGGMATVYKAYDRDLQRTIALKVLPEYFQHDPTLIQRFRQEAIHAARLEHPNIITIFDVGEDKGLLYFAMQYVEGHTLRQLLDERGPLPFSETADITKQIASALDYAHSQGYVHRDVKPTNILIGKSGQAILTDFGIVKAADGTSLTRTGAIVGTPEYMSPEQVKGLEVDHRTDIYSLAVVCYEMLTRRAPFRGDTASVLHAQVYERPTPVHRLSPNVPTGVDAVLERAMNKEPQRRYGTAGEMAQALQRALASAAITEAPTLFAGGRPASLDRMKQSLPLSPSMLVGITLVVVALAVGVSLINRPGPLPAIPASPTPSLTATPTTVPPTHTRTMPPIPPTPTTVPPTPTSLPATATPRPTAAYVPAPTATSAPCFRGEVTRIEQIAWPLIQIHGSVVDENGRPLRLVMVRIDAGTTWYWAAQTWQNGAFGCDILAQPGTWFVSLPEVTGKPTVEVKIEHGERAIVTFTRGSCE